ncbi:hypothetical protein EJ05DRAFT_476906 [Pseudovirgaria hyperparasitica]|uniref:Osmotin, thaumatin-like protein n=1 Tax=Pseudovirgaria hyperparasitica TaxID=470096 RepID=A0A6A6W677_9PEZI|nr:uncharacterized protein EJ05DRAFT_476906 [Pseudovirgaria hyperparasitica]KAF2757689.1 hypothetical protein EJ05DRAFT_476906 [Pseudovirgaria hyperparasitica]
MISKASFFLLAVSILAGNPTAANVLPAPGAPLSEYANLTLAGEAIIVNNCPFDVFAYSVDCDRGFTAAEEFIVRKRSVYKEPIRIPSNLGGISIKINTMSTAGPAQVITQLEYTVAPPTPYSADPGVFKMPGMIYYDLSFVDCAMSAATGAERCPLWVNGLAAICDGEDEGCENLVCPPNTECPSAAYYDPSGSASVRLQPDGTYKNQQPNSAVVGLDKSIRFTLCESTSALKRGATSFIA